MLKGQILPARAPTPAALPELDVQYFESQTAATGMDCAMLDSVLGRM